MTPEIARFLLPSVADARERADGALRVPREWLDAGGVRAHLTAPANLSTPANLAAPGASGPAWWDALDVRDERTLARPAPGIEVRVGGAACGTSPTDLQGYRLRIEAATDEAGGGGATGAPRQARATIDAPTPSGALHALATLRQVLRASASDAPVGGPLTLPALDISDRPAFQHRGLMLDVSRDRVPTMEHLLGLVDALAALKMNHLQLYTEHTFAYAGHEEVWRGWSPMTPDEVRTLDAHCRRRGVRLAANQNCFGHLASWLRCERYAPLAEIAPGQRWSFYDWERVGPFSLCPTDARSLALVEDMLGQLLPCFTSRVVNINCDETADVGQGRSRDEVEQRGRFEVYRDFVSRVCEVARGHGCAPQFWADIALAFPERLHELPEDLTALAWSYEPDPVEGAEAGAAGKPSFARWGRALRGAGRTFWVCPGTSAWRSTVGRSAERAGNLRDAARAGAEHGAEGFMVTEWGDLGHRQQWPVSLHAIAHAAEHAWRGTWRGPAASDAWTYAADVQVWGGAGVPRGLSAWMGRLGDVDAPLRATGGALSGVARNAGLPLRNQGFLFADMHTAWDRLREAGTPEGFAHAERELAALRESLPRLDDALVPAELGHTLEVAGLALDRALARRRTGATRDEGVACRRGLAARVRAIGDEHRRLWLRRSREGGLSSSCEHYAKVLRELEEGA